MEKLTLKLILKAEETRGNKRKATMDLYVVNLCRVGYTILKLNERTKRKRA
jgi:hypothetical protein